MRLIALELENFKGIGDRQRVELRPITLLFGPNSAGKSTILQALHYAREILARHNVDPDVTLAGGLLNLGGFASLVHRHELDRSVGLKLEVELATDQGAEELPLNSGIFLEEDDFSELQVRYLVGESERLGDYSIVQAVGVEVEVRWSEQEATPYVSRIGVEMDGLAVAAIVSPPEHGRAQLTEFNFAHPLLAPAEPPEEAISSMPAAGSPLEDLLWLLSREVVIDRSDPETPPGDIRVGVETAFGALPSLDRELYLELRDPEPNKAELEQRTPRILALRRLLDEMALGPLRIVRRCLEEMTYIGPLRQVPTRGYRPQVSPDEARWAQGLAAWDLLYTARDDKLIADTSRWLSDEQRLDTGYEIERREYRRIPIPGPFAAFFQRGLREDDVVDLQALFERLPRDREVVLRELRTGVAVGPSDVGVGLSQLIPIVIAVLARDSSLLAIEQPELHVHPAIQVGLGDLLIAGVQADESVPARDRILLVETHSEHLMLRLLRRIRETAENELPPGASPLRADDVAVVYVEIPRQDDFSAGPESARFTPLRISAEGEFVDRWPRGFFEERVEELF